MNEDKLVPVTLKELIIYFLKLGTFVFGGPVVLCEHMRQQLVENKKWVTADEYNEGFSLSQMAPGPLATQLAIYLGWVRGGVSWATIAGIVFVLPSFLIVLVLAALYVSYGGLSWIHGVFYGVGSSVIAIMAISSQKLFKKTFKKDYLFWTIGITSALITIWTESENLLLFLLAGILVAIIKGNFRNSSPISSLLIFPDWFASGFYSLESSTRLSQLFLFFLKSGALVFGSGLAIVPFLHSGVVLEHQWLTERQFLDAVAVAMITPGPIVITVAFIGYLVSGPIGGFIAALGVFLPCYLFVVIPAPFYNRIAKNSTIKGFVDGVTVAAVGAIAGATVILGKRAILDIPTVILFFASIIILIRFKKFPEPLVILTAGIIGLILK